MQRFSVVGSTGSGKTTVASAIGDTLGAPVLELDAIHWGPNWTPTDRDTIREQVQEFLPGYAWVVDGNYRGMAQDLVWAAADTVVWLDLPFRTNATQLIRRTFRRAVRRERLWAGNRESLRKALFSRDSILRWLIKTHRKNRRRYLHDMSTGAYPHLQWIRLRSHREIDTWLESLTEASPPSL